MSPKDTRNQPPKLLRGDPEIDPGLGIAIDLPQEPAVPPEGQGVDNDIQGHHQDRPQDDRAPRPFEPGLPLQRKPSPLPAARGQRHQRQGIAGIGQEDIGQGIHEGHPGHPEFLVHRGGDIEVLAKGKAAVNGGELRRPGDEIAQNQEGQGPAGPQVPDGDQQVGPQKDEHIGPQPDGARQEPQKVDHIRCSAKFSGRVRSAHHVNGMARPRSAPGTATIKFAIDFSAFPCSSPPGLKGGRGDYKASRERKKLSAIALSPPDAGWFDHGTIPQSRFYGQSAGIGSRQGLHGPGSICRSTRPAALAADFPLTL